MSANPDAPAGTVFRAVFWKELREGFRWCVAGLLITSGIWAAALKQLAFGGNVAALFDSTPVAAALVGLVIGLTQIIPENRGDSWGFLAHRPASRTTLFLGKVAAGVLLFLVAFAVPILGVLVWQSVPGHIAQPFDWRLGAPVIVDTLAGLGFYFAALMTGIRNGRWYASRAMGLAAACVCAFAVTLMRNFSDALLAAAIGLVVLGTAAWSHFIAGGDNPPQPLAGRWATGTAIGTGLAAVVWVVVCVAIAFFPSEQAPTDVSAYTIASDGAVVQTVRRDDAIVAVNDLEGRPIEKYQSREAIQKLGAGVLSGGEAYLDLSGLPYYEGVGAYRGASAVFRVVGDYNNSAFLWYYVHRSRLLAVYERRSARLIGWMGPDGFVSGQAQPEHRFDGPLLRGNYYYYMPARLAFPGAVYRLDMDQRRIEKIFTAPPGEHVVGASQQHASELDLIRFGERAQFHMIVTDRKIYVESDAGGVQLAAPPDPLARGYGTVVVYRPLLAAADITYFWCWPAMGSLPIDEWYRLPTQITALGANGDVIAHYTVPSGRSPEPERWGPAVSFSLVTPLAVSGTEFALGARNVFGVGSSSSSPLRTVTWTLTIAMAVAAASVAFVRTRAFAFSPRRVGLWTTLCFLLGPVGIGVLLSVEDWPARETCSTCGRRRVVTRDRCEHCSAPFPPPARDGTEIFEGAL